MVETKTQRPLGVTILAVLNILGGILALFLGITYISLSATLAQTGGVIAGGSGIFALFGAFIIVLGLIFLIIAILAIAVGWGFLKGKRWAWTLSLILYAITIILGVTSLVAGDVTSIVVIIIGGLLVYYLFRPKVKAWFGKA